MKLILRPKDHKAQYLNLVTGKKSMTRLGEVSYADPQNRSIAHMLVNSPQMLQLIRDMHESLSKILRSGIRELTSHEQLFMSQADGIVMECSSMKEVA